MKELFFGSEQVLQNLKALEINAKFLSLNQIVLVSIASHDYGKGFNSNRQNIPLFIT